eukprot:6127463-Pyramimonas_sp.AAC.1
MPMYCATGHGLHHFSERSARRLGLARWQSAEEEGGARAIRRSLGMLSYWVAVAAVAPLILARTHRAPRAAPCTMGAR